MTDKLTQLAQARAEAEEAKAKQKEMLDTFQQSKEWVDLQLARIGAQTQIDALEAQIKDDALLIFRDGGPKKQEGVEVKGFGVVNDYDKAKAREWCLTDFRPALKLDEKTFEKAVKDGTVPESIAIATIEYRAQIATDLSKYLPSAIPGAANA